MKIIKYGPEAAAEAAEIIINGGIVIFPTETVYGIGALPGNENAVKRLFEIKKRPENKPLQILISDPEQVNQFAAEISASANELMKKYWPGPLTLIFKSKPGSSADPTVGLRMPDHKIVIELLGRTGPIAATSANLSGQPDPITAGEVKIEADLLIDGGPCAMGRASTVIDVSVDPPVIIRKGNISPF